jgi:hypothetical protein
MSSPQERSRNAPLPQNAEQFEAYMVAMDAHFKAIQLPIAARQLAAVAETGIDQGRSDVKMPTMRPPTEACYSGDDLLLHAAKWFERRYPEQAQVDFSIGSSVVELHGQLWEYKVPLGEDIRLLYVGDEWTGPATAPTPQGYPSIPPNHPARRSLKRSSLVPGVVGLSAELAASLSEEEQWRILVCYCRARLAYFWLVRARHHHLVRTAIGDCSSSVYHLLRMPADTGLSRWASLQAVEKLLKSYLHHAGVRYKQVGRAGHDLGELARLVGANGGASLDKASLQSVQCTASVRYESSKVPLAEAIAAHYAVLDLIDGIATDLCQRFPLETTPRTGDALSAARDLVHFIAERSGLHQPQ